MSSSNGSKRDRENDQPGYYKYDLYGSQDMYSVYSTVNPFDPDEPEDIVEMPSDVKKTVKWAEEENDRDFRKCRQLFHEKDNLLSEISKKEDWIKEKKNEIKDAEKWVVAAKKYYQKLNDDFEETDKRSLARKYWIENEKSRYL